MLLYPLCFYHSVALDGGSRLGDIVVAAYVGEA